MNKLYERIKYLCQKNGISIRKLEQDCGFSHGSISKWDHHKPSFEKLRAVANYFNEPVDYFITSVQSYEQQGYYTDSETVEIAQMIFDDPNLRILFDAARDCKPQDLLMAVDMLKRFKGESNVYP